MSVGLRGKQFNYITVAISEVGTPFSSGLASSLILGALGTSGVVLNSAEQVTIIFHMPYKRLFDVLDPSRAPSLMTQLCDELDSGAANMLYFAMPCKLLNSYLSNLRRLVMRRASTSPLQHCRDTVTPDRWSDMPWVHCPRFRSLRPWAS